MVDPALGLGWRAAVNAEAGQARRRRASQEENGL
jgi:hypothetical protein